MRQSVSRDLLVWTIGIIVGATVGINLDEGFFTGSQDLIFALVGALVGGLTAYVAHDLKGFAKGVGRAFSMTWSGAGRGLAKLRAWRPDWLYWREFAKLFFASLPTIGSLVGPLAFLEYADGMSLFGPVFIVGLTSFISVLFTAFNLALALTVRPNGSIGRNLAVLKDFQHIMIRYLNLVAGAIWLLIGGVYVIRRIPRVIMWAIAQGPKVVRWTITQGPLVKKFLVLTFRYVHNSQRTISFLVSVVGAFAGTVMGSVTMGLAFGLPFGVILAYVIAPVVARMQIPENGIEVK